MALPEDQISASLHISGVLDDIGVNTRTVTRRQQTFLTREKVQTIYSKLRNKNLTLYHFGSQVEGTTTEGLDSDLDSLICHNDVNVIQDITEWKKGKQTYLVLQGGGIPAGYCRLQLLSTYNPEGATRVADADKECLVKDNEGRVLVKNNLHFRKTVQGSEVHGPSQAITKADFVERDNVFADICKEWPTQAKQWFSRVENKPWPTVDTVKSARESGFFLVPVGHRLSDTRSLEWRVSPSLTERSLMLSLNITQLKCYVIIKMAKKKLITPVIGESISSFQLKTTLFHCIEHKEPGFWREDNLLNCLNLCLSTLQFWLKHRYCPNFIIPGENLFSGRIQDEKVDPIMHIIEKMIKSKGRFLFDISFDQVGTRLNESVSAGPVRSPSLSPQSMRMIAFCETELQKFKSSHVNVILNCSDIPVREENVKSMTRRIVNYIEYLVTVKAESDLHTVLAANGLLGYMFTFMGSVLASDCISSKKQIPRTAMSFMEKGVHSDLTSGRLKLVSTLYCSGDAERAVSILEDLEKRYDTDSVQPVCGCHNEVPGFRALDAFSERISFCEPDSDRSQLMASCVIYLPQESHSCPPELRYEMFRGVGDDLQLRVEEDSWMDCAAIDSVTYLHFMLYVIYRKLGKHLLKERALGNLIESIKYERPLLRHVETAFNMLGQCMEAEQKLNDAIQCYQLSLKERPRNNAAKWLIALCIFKHVRKLSWCVTDNGGSPKDEVTVLYSRKAKY